MIQSSTTVRVRYCEVDRMAAANSGRYFDWFELARSDLLREAGLPYGKLEETGFLAPVVEASCKYIRKIGYDEMIRIDTSLEVISPVRLRFDFRVFLCEKGKDVPAARGHTVNAVVGRDGRVRPLPDEVLELLGAAD